MVLLNSSLYLPSQALQYAVWDTTFRTELQRGALLLSPGATLTWLAFSDQGTLCTMDSEGCASCPDSELLEHLPRRLRT